MDPSLSSWRLILEINFYGQGELPADASKNPPKRPGMIFRAKQIRVWFAAQTFPVFRRGNG
jgi:hypothetical protein